MRSSSPHQVGGAASIVIIMPAIFVPDDARMIVHAETPGAFATDPEAGHRHHCRCHCGHREAKVQHDSANASPTSDPKVPGATGASPDPKPNANNARARAAGADESGHASAAFSA